MLAVKHFDILTTIIKIKTLMVGESIKNIQ